MKLWNKIKSELLIILTLVALLLIGLFSWLRSPTTKDFGLNFFTEMLGVAVTVIIIDRLIQNKEEKRNIPQKLAAYEDVRLYTSRYISFWTSAYQESVPYDKPGSIEEFFSENGMSKILQFLYMDSEPNVVPPLKWWDWIIQNAKEFKDNGDKLLDRHSYNLDPKAFGFVHQLTESNFNNVLLKSSSLRETENLWNFPNIRVLGSYSIPPQKEDFDAILGLVKWCNASYLSLKKYSDSIKKVTEYKPQVNRKMPPKCQIPYDVLEQQRMTLIEFRQRNK